MSFAQIDIHEVKEMVDAESATIIDIRNPYDYAAGHIEGARHVIDPDAAAQLCAEVPSDQPLVVYCYHGISSQQAAAYFAESGFDQVYSMVGGYEEWSRCYPTANA